MIAPPSGSFTLATVVTEAPAVAVPSVKLSAVFIDSVNPSFVSVTDGVIFAVEPTHPYVPADVAVGVHRINAEPVSAFARAAPAVVTLTPHPVASIPRSVGSPQL